MYGLIERSQRAAADLSEALGVGQAPPQVPLTPLPSASPTQMPPGAFGVPPPGQLPANLQHPSPLVTMSDFKSPPVAAALQGPQGVMGHPAMQQQPTGFARGGFAVFKDR